jgi:glycosyltransferase involved in cell wall biosynthesis
MIGAKVTTSETLEKPCTAVSPQPRPRLSVIVPLYNEEESIRPLYAAIVQALGDIGCTFEMVFVDDGSKDNTAEIAREIARIDARLRLVKFRRNYGQTPAMAAGIEHARGEILVTMDGDLQNDPADIKSLLEQIEAGYDIVVGWRHNRQDKLVTRKIPSRIANLLIGKVTGVPIRDNGCSLKAFRAELIKSIPLYSEMHRFIPAMASIAGPRVAQIRVRHHARRYGQSKYGLSRIYKVLLDLMVIKTVTSFASRPLRWFAYLSAPLILIGFAFLGHELLSLLAGASRLSWPLAGTGVIFLASGMILLCSGALAELIYSRGDVRDNDFFRLTQTIRRRSEAPDQNQARPLSTVTTKSS